MRATLAVAALAGVTIAGAAAQEAKPSPPRSVTLLDGTAVTPGPAPFRDGEELIYRLQGPLGVTLGTAAMIVEPGTWEGRPALHLRSSLAGAALGMRASGESESWIHPEELWSYGFVTESDTSNIDDRQVWTLDYAKGLAIRERVRTKDGVTKNTRIEKALSKTHVQDASSMLYFFRAFPVTVGSKLQSDVYTSKKLWSLTVKIPAKETVKTPAGKFSCLRVVPEASHEGVKRSDGNVVIWVTDDERKMPVKVQMQMKLGAATAVLLEDRTKKRRK